MEATEQCQMDAFENVTGIPERNFFFTWKPPETYKEQNNL